MAPQKSSGKRSGQKNRVFWAPARAQHNGAIGLTKRGALPAAKRNGWMRGPGREEGSSSKPLIGRGGRRLVAREKPSRRRATAATETFSEQMLFLFAAFDLARAREQRGLRPATTK